MFRKITLTFAVVLASLYAAGQDAPAKEDVLETMQLVNQYLMDKWPDPGVEVVTNIPRTSNLWTRGVYYEGLMALYEIDPKPAYYDYAVEWGESHNWKFGVRSGDRYVPIVYTRNADAHCAGQTYIDLYQMDPQPERIAPVKASIDSMLNTDKIDDWDWIDAIQMAMPVFARLGVVYNDNAYYDRMHEMYMYTRDEEGENGMYNPKDGLWWRDADYDPPYTEPNGEDCYWSRGNGWVIAALARVLDITPEDLKYRKQYEKDLKAMAKALIKVQREDGFWNVSLHDPNNYGGKETTGTALFVYGIAYGINNGLLSEKKYKPVALKAWNAMVNDAVHPNGFLGYVQGTGKDPSAGQPVTYDSKPDFEDYGTGCFLLAGVEIYKMLDK